MKYLIFDASATGKPKSYKAPVEDTFNWPRLIHLSWIILDENLKPVEDFDCVVKPEGFSITPTISKLCKIDEEDIKNKGENISDILNSFKDSIDKVDYVFAHNLNFNENVVGAEFIRKGIRHHLHNAVSYCLMQESTWFCKLPAKGNRGYKWPSLTELHAILFKKAYGPPNNARADVIAASRCFIMLKKIGQLDDCVD